MVIKNKSKQVQMNFFNYLESKTTSSVDCRIENEDIGSLCMDISLCVCVWGGGGGGETILQ